MLISCTSCGNLQMSMFYTSQHRIPLPETAVSWPLVLSCVHQVVELCSAGSGAVHGLQVVGTLGSKGNDWLTLDGEDF